MKKISWATALFATLMIVGCGGGGGDNSTSQASVSGSTESKGVSPSVPTSHSGRLFAEVGGEIFSFPDMNFITAGTLSGEKLASDLIFNSGLVYDAGRDRLYVATKNVRNDPRIDRARIVVFDRASELTGAIQPNRTITPIIPKADAFTGIFLDKERDVLYVSVRLTFGAALAVFNNVSTLSGEVSPSRMFSALANGSIAVDVKRSILYISDGGSGQIIVYHDLDKLDGAIPPSSAKKINLNPQGRFMRGVAVDSARDRLYVGHAGQGLRILENASLAGTTVPVMEFTDAALIALPNVPVTGSAVVAYDSNNDRIYASFDNVVYAVNSASKLNAQSSTIDAFSTAAPPAVYVTGFAFP